MRPPLEQAEQLGVVEAVGEAERTAPVGSGLAVRREGGRPLGGGGRVEEHRRVVAGRLGVVGEAGVIGGRQVGQGAQQGGVQRAPPGRRDGALDGEARELVPEREPGALLVQDPGRPALLEGVQRLRRDEIEQAQVGPAGHDRDGVEQAPRRRGEAARPCEHRLPHGGRQAPAGGEHLGHVERVASRPRVELAGVQRLLGRERGHGGEPTAAAAAAAAPPARSRGCRGAPSAGVRRRARRPGR